MPVHNARYITGPGNPGGVDGMRPEPKCGAQAGDPNDDPSAHDDLILAKFPGSRGGDSFPANGLILFSHMYTNSFIVLPVESQRS